jgi:hypothetical protein
MNRISESLQVLLWSYVFVYVVSCSLQIIQYDTWWQLSEGFHILSTFSLPTQPAAAFGLPANPYFDEYAGYEVVLALLYKATGFLGLWMLFITIYLTIIFLPSIYSKRNNSTFDIFSTLALLLAGLLLRGRLVQRPELVASLLQVFLMILLRKWKLETVTLRSLIPLFFIFLVWTNTHSTFVIGFFTLFLWIGCETFFKFKNIPIRLLLKNALLIGGVALFAVMLNPYGPERLVFPFLQAFDPGSTALSPEMWPITNFRTIAAISVLIAIVLLAWAILTSRQIPFWLTLFSIFAVYMTIKSFRWVNLLAIALLFVYAAREAQIKPIILRPLPLVWLKAAALSSLCLFMLFGDAYSFIFAFNEISPERHFATHTSNFASDIVDTDVFGSDKRLPALCGHGEGAYLSFIDNKSFRPILDSGMIHFSNDSKRYFFFVWHEPEALILALKYLDVDYVILNQETFHWTLDMRRVPGWTLIACTKNGMLWQRCSGGIYIPSPSDVDKIAASRDALLQKGDIIGAFCYSTLLNRPCDSLAILSKYDGSEWPESFFNYFSAWVDSLSQTTIQEYLSADHDKRYPLMYAVLSARLSPESCARFIKTTPPGPKPWFWEAVRVRNDIARGDMEGAHAIFDTISTTQPSSVTYYKLWHEVRKGISKANEDNLSAYGQWQTWDDNARNFIESMSAQLNQRIVYLNGSGR